MELRFFYNRLLEGLFELSFLITAATAKTILKIKQDRASGGILGSLLDPIDRRRSVQG